MSTGKKVIKLKLTDFWNGFDCEDNWFIDTINASDKYRVELSEKPDVLIYSVFGYEHFKYNCKRVFYTGENVRPDFGRCDFSFSFDSAAIANNFRLPNYRRRYPYVDLIRNRNWITEEFFNRGFCSFIVSNGDVEIRNAFFDRLSQYKKVDSGGRYRNNIGKPVDDKLGFMAGYKFNIAFENEQHPGYTTEKLIEAWMCGTVPIYWGNPEIEKEINPDCFVNISGHDDFERAVQQIKEIDSDPDTYMKYLRAPLFKNNTLPENLTEAYFTKAFERVIESRTERKPIIRMVDKFKYIYLEAKNKWLN